MGLNDLNTWEKIWYGTAILSAWVTLLWDTVSSWLLTTLGLNWIKYGALVWLWSSIRRRGSNRVSKTLWSSKSVASTLSAR